MIDNPLSNLIKELEESNGETLQLQSGERIIIIEVTQDKNDPLKIRIVEKKTGLIGEFARMETAVLIASVLLRPAKPNLPVFAKMTRIKDGRGSRIALPLTYQV